MNNINDVEVWLKNRIDKAHDFHWSYNTFKKNNLKTWSTIKDYGHDPLYILKNNNKINNECPTYTPISNTLLIFFPTLNKASCFFKVSLSHT